MGNKLFVGNLSWGTDDESLRQAFLQFGNVTDVKVVLDRETGRSRGFGFVTFDTEDAARKALQAMDGAAVDGRNVRVNEAEDRRGNGPRPGGGYSGGYDQSYGTTQNHAGGQSWNRGGERPENVGRRRREFDYQPETTYVGPGGRGGRRGGGGGWGA